MFSHLKYFITVCALLKFITGQTNFRVIRQWKYINYTWPSIEAYSTAIIEGQYIPENVVLSGLVVFDDWFYLTMPRMKKGVPVTLGRISSKQGGSTTPLISPYPTWELNTADDCNALQNVQNVQVDATGQLWIIDGGHTLSLTAAPIKNCTPKLIIYDINNNSVLTTYSFPEFVASKRDSFLYDLVLDGNYAYLTDNSDRDPGIIVYSRQENKSWKFRHAKSMKADPAAQNFTMNGIPITSPINIAGIAIGPSINGIKEIYYCPLTSLNLYSISSSVLKNEINSNNITYFDKQVKLVGQKASQTDCMFMSDQGILYYSLLPDNSIAMWDSQTPFASGQKLLTRDVKYIQWSNSFTTDHKGNLILLTNVLQEFIYESLDVNETNAWLLSAYIGEEIYVNNKSFSNKNTSTSMQNVSPLPLFLGLIIGVHYL